MSIVHVLPSDVIARIAAGEVVERPASVVKELVENSLDAGATRVEVHLKEGGKAQIHIKDNGKGISREDLLVLFQRHATSKITSALDLDKVLSLGFRGEALYSVGSVAEVNIKSRAAGSADAWDMDVKGGRKSDPSPVAMAAQGTEIRVNELFFNTPARKKFLKSDASETEQVLNIFLPYTLLYPERSFLLTHNGRTLLDVAPAPAAERFARALNLEAKHILTGEGAMSAEDARLRFIMGDINIQRHRRDLQFLFVNGRPVQSRNILFHVNEMYRLIMPDGVHPAFAVFLDVPPEDVDVNVHPAKREVRIRQEARLGGFLRTQAEQILMTQGGAKVVKGAEPLFALPEQVPFNEGIAGAKIVFGPGQRSSLPEPVAREAAPLFAQFAADVAQDRQGALKDRLLRTRFIGTFACKYHLFEEGESLFVIDQHAAQERILFEKFRDQIASDSVEVQHLLTPLILKLTPQERVAFDEVQEKLRLFGFETTLLDGQAVAVHSVPVVLPSPELAVRALLADEQVAHTDHDTLARRACRASVMTGDVMQGQEAVYQLKTLMGCADPFTCPHGRPVFVELRSSFLDRQFLRTG
ncbi:MAG: DNA mismatch repair endonuclease MutL [Candidatus Omnitrophica bacterium]|nr:DNA mismatch repair endonuclease MutL [Candidatus Omnitrophota bacterium]